MKADKFLKERIAEVEKRIASSPDYKEMKLLKKMLEEFETGVVIAQPTLVIGKRPYTKSGKFTRAGGYKKDMDNSPAKDIRYGGRIKHMYDTVEQIVKKAGGEINVLTLDSILKNEYNLAWIDLGQNGRDKKGRICTYINSYNKNHEDDQRLSLWPLAKEGHNRPWRYEKVIYTGRKKLETAIAL